MWIPMYLPRYELEEQINSYQWIPQGTQSEQGRRRNGGGGGEERNVYFLIESHLYCLDFSSTCIL